MAQDIAFFRNPDLKFILFGGKGGAGKTTAASATALHFALQWPDKKVLLVSTDPAHSLADSLADSVADSLDQGVGNEITSIQGVENLFALVLDAEALLEAFKAQYGKVIKLIIARGTYFDEEDITSFFDLSLPGMDEVMTIIKIMDLMKKEQYDLVILDTASPAHTIRLLALPRYMEQWIHIMNMKMEKHRFMVKMFKKRYVPDAADRFLQMMADDLQRVQELLKNAETTEFVPVVIPEAMSIYETETLLHAIDEGGIAVRTVILNRLVDSRSCLRCRAREKDQVPYRQEIEKKFGRYNLVNIPLFPHEISGVEDLTAFAALLFNARPTARRPQPLAFINPVEGNVQPPTGSGHERPGLADLLGRNQQFILFGGKSGVGKTTLAAVTALEMARRQPGKKTLIFSTDPAGSLADSLGCSIGAVPTPIEGVSGLYALQINIEDRLKELKQRYMQETNAILMRFLGGDGMDATFDKDVMLDLIPPCLDEVVALISIMDLLEEGTYDHFIIDTAPTGHLLRFLELPQLAMDWFSALYQILQKYQGVVTLTRTNQLVLEMSNGIEKVRGHLVNARRSEFVAVTVPEAMGVFDTQRSLVTLDHLQIPCQHLVVNRVMPPTACDFCLVKREEQQGYIRGLRDRFSRYIVTELPFFPHEIRGLVGLREVSRAIYGDEGG